MFNLLLGIFTIFTFLFSTTPVQAFKAETFVTLVNLIDDFKTNEKTKLTPLTIPRFVYEESTPSAVVNSWYLTSGAINSSTISAYFKKISTGDKKQEIGLFLKNGVSSDIQNLPPAERERFVDKQMEEFFGAFGYYPKTITAQNFDAYTLEYLQTKYSVLGVVVVPVDGANLPSYNGAYANAPFFPSKNNHYLPAKSLKTRINLSFSESVPLEGFNFAEGLSFYTQKFFNEFTEVNFSLSNTSTTLDKTKFKQALNELLAAEDKHNLRFASYSTFSDWFKARYPESTPAFLYKQENEDKTTNYLYQSPWYKLEFTDTKDSTELKNLYVYNHKESESNLATPSLVNIEHLAVTNQLGVGKYLTLSKKGGMLITNYLKQWDSWAIAFQNQTEKISLEPNKITFNNLNVPLLDSNLIAVKNSKNTTTWTPVEFSPFQNSSTVNKFFWLITFLVLLFVLFKNKPPFLGLFLLFVVSLTLVRSGSLYPFGMGFWGPNGHDAVFHLSLIQKFANSPLTLSHPQVAGEVLSNYHFFFDYFSGLVVRFTHTPVLYYYFFVYPLFAGVILIKLIGVLSDNLSLTRFQKNIATTFVFLGSSLGFLVQLLRGGDLFVGESTFWSNQSISSFLNPPFVFSLIFILGFLTVYNKAKKTLLDFFILAILGILLSQVKVYGFILLLAGLLINRDFSLFAVIGLGGFLLNLPFSSVNSSPFLFQPLWFIRTMVESYDRLNWPRAAAAWQAYEATGNFGKLLFLNFVALCLFLIGNLGVRIVGIYHCLVTKPQSQTDKLVRVMIFSSLIIPLLFTQSINPWNTIQFFYYGLFFLSFYVAMFFSRPSALVFVLVVVGTIGSFGTLRDYVTVNSTSRISYTELSALSKLSTLKKGVVLSPPNQNRTVFSPPQPQYDYITSSYISALSGQPEYLSDQINLDITGINYQQKLKNANRFYNTTDVSWTKEFLVENNILYVYETPLRKLNIPYEKLNLETIFTSPEITIYQVTGI